MTIQVWKTLRCVYVLRIVFFCFEWEKRWTIYVLQRMHQNVFFCFTSIVYMVYFWTHIWWSSIYIYMYCSHISPVNKLIYFAHHPIRFDTTTVNSLLYTCKEHNIWMDIIRCIRLIGQPYNSLAKYKVTTQSLESNKKQRKCNVTVKWIGFSLLGSIEFVWLLRLC